MPIICRLVQLSEDQATRLIDQRVSLADTLASAKRYTDVYRYWHGIEYLLRQHAPAASAAAWLSLGRSVSAGEAGIPAARALPPPDVAALHTALEPIAPDELAPHYDAAALDAAEIYPRTWVMWEEDFDPLGQVLEHYFYLQRFAAECAAAHAAMLLQFEFVNDGSDP